MSKSGIPIVSDVAKAVKPIVQPIAKAIRPLAPILPFIPIPGMFGLSSLVTRALLTGALGGLDKQGKFNVGRGVKSGLLAYGIGSLMPSTAAAGTAPTGGTLDGSTLMPDYDPFGSAADLSAAGISSSAPAAVLPAAPPVVPPTGPVPDANVISYTPDPNSVMGGARPIGDVAEGIRATATDVRAPTIMPSPNESFVPPGAGGQGLKFQTAPAEGFKIASDAASSLGSGPTMLDKALNYASSLPSKALEYAIDKPIPAALGATTAYGAISSKQELDRQKEEAERIVRNREREKAENVARAESFLRDYPLLYKQFTAEDVQRMGLASGGMAGNDPEYGNEYEMGGLASLAGGGMPPRYLRGGGDGMSDSIPARIGEKQEARLADGEFVVPADVVSHIGNGSSNAGAKKLYAMMDRVRQARTGKTRQAPAVNMRRMMPV